MTDHQTLLTIAGLAEAGEGEPFEVTNPATEQPLAEVRAASGAQVKRAVDGARAVLASVRLAEPAERSAALGRLADILVERQDEIVAMEVAEVGTPIGTARVIHIDIPVALLRGFAKLALIDRTVRLGAVPGPPANDGMIIFRPVGVVAGVTAYNAPLMFAAAKAGAAFAAGCPTVLLPSMLAPLSTLRFAQYVLEAGFPAGAVSALAGGAEVAQKLIASPEVAKVSFTGSAQTGTAVMQQAAVGTRGVVLELGGKSAAILLPSANAVAQAPFLLPRYLRNAGQGCAAPTRILVHESQAGPFIAACRETMASVKVGDPLDPKTLVGPLISAAHRDRVLGYIDSAIGDGGHVIAQSAVPTLASGWYAPATLLGGLGNDARINQEEVFGPVATLQVYRTVDEAVQIANDTRYGLHAMVYGPLDEAITVARRLDAGQVSINGGAPIRGDIAMGGWKGSGIGREVGEAGVREFLEPVTMQWPV